MVEILPNKALLNGALLNQALLNGALLNGALLNQALLNGALLNHTHPEFWGEGGRSPPCTQNSGGVWGGKGGAKPPHRPASEGPASEGPVSEGPDSEGPDSEGLQFLIYQNPQNPKRKKTNTFPQNVLTDTK